MINIDDWIQDYQEIMLQTFGKRVLFIGLQGSYSRGEASEKSDIDVVLILDTINIDDLQLYKQVTSNMPNREMLCGFVSGKNELAAWIRFDLFQFFHDTLPLYGQLTDIISPITANEAREAILSGVCNIYHICNHNFLHAMNCATLAELYRKPAFFVMQAKYYLEHNGQYIRSRIELQNNLNDDDLQIMQISTNPELITAETFEQYTKLLLQWSSKLLQQYSISDAPQQ